jgi:hypothetical protein
LIFSSRRRWREPHDDARDRTFETRLGSTDRLLRGEGGKVISVHTSQQADHSTEWVFDEEGQLRSVTVSRPVHRA